MIEKKLRLFTVERLRDLGVTDPDKKTVERMAQLAGPFELINNLARLQTNAAAEIYKNGTFEFNSNEFLIRNNGRGATLSPAECKLMALFLNHPSQLLPHQFLSRQLGITNDNAMIDEYDKNLLRHNISMLRSKFKLIGLKKVLIENLHGRGYRFVYRSKLEEKK